MKSKQHKNEINRNYRQRVVIRWREEGLCTNCGSKIENTKFKTCFKCRTKVGRYHKQLREKAIADGLCRYCRKVPFREGTTICVQCSEKYKVDPKSRRVKYLKDKRIVIEHYGGYTCNCCGVLYNHIFLSVDHINNDGKIKRKDQTGTHGIYDWIIKHDFPTDFQILCLNCNIAKKSNSGVCPHQDPNYNWNEGNDTSDEE